MENESVAIETVRVQIARCPICKNITQCGVVHALDKESWKTYLDLMKDGYEMSQMKLLDFRALPDYEMCFSDCENPKIIERKMLIEKHTII